jgi:hypothetical protein
MARKVSTAQRGLAIAQDWALLALQLSLIYLNLKQYSSALVQREVLPLADRASWGQSTVHLGTIELA